MKKVVLCVVFVLALLCCFAQKVRTVAEIPFDGEFDYFVSDANDAPPVGIDNLFVHDDTIYFTNAMTCDWYYLDKNKKARLLFSPEDLYFFDKTNVVFCTEDKTFVYGYLFASGHRSCLSIKSNDKKTDVMIDNSKILEAINNPIHRNYYLMNNILFIEDKGLVSIDLRNPENIVCRNISETKKLLDSGLGESLGHRVEMDADGNLIGNFFGDHAVDSSKNGLMYYFYRNEKMDMSKSGYNDRDNLDDTLYRILGYDDKGLTYFYEALSYGDTNSSYFDICVYDTWTKTPYFYEDYDKGQWNPPLDENGIEIPSLGFTVSNKGEVYYSDCDLSGKKYLIKQVENRWYDDIGIKNRHIGSVNASRVPYYKKASSKKAPVGFCFKGDLVWEKDAKDGWSKVQRLDGSTVWIETKYIDF